MSETEEVQCPYCGQPSCVALDACVRSQRFTTDCEVCCRPFEVHVECEGGEVVSVEVASG